MKMQTILLLIVVFAIAGAGFVVFRPKGNVKPSPQLQDSPKQIPGQARDDKLFQLTSSAFSHYQPIPQKYTCDGEDISPPLTITGAPKEAQSLLLIVDDPDSPTGEFVHWVVANISPDVEEISEGTIPPESTTGMTSFGKAQYGGPCPPKGTHRYFFTLYALDTKLGLIGKTKKELMDSINGHSFGKAILIGTYERKSD